MRHLFRRLCRQLGTQLLDGAAMCTLHRLGIDPYLLSNLPEAQAVPVPGPNHGPFLLRQLMDGFLHTLSHQVVPECPLFLLHEPQVGSREKEAAVAVPTLITPRSQSPLQLGAEAVG